MAAAKSTGAVRSGEFYARRELELQAGAESAESAAAEVELALLKDFERHESASRFPNIDLICQGLLVRGGVICTCMTAVLPDFADGYLESSQTLSAFHLAGVVIGAGLILSGVLVSRRFP